MFLIRNMYVVEIAIFLFFHCFIEQKRRLLATTSNTITKTNFYYELNDVE